MDITAIESIPICTAYQEDIWAWNFEKSGLFSVRSAYRVLVNTKKNPGGLARGEAIEFIFIDGRKALVQDVEGEGPKQITCFFVETVSPIYTYWINPIS
jgi:hypothetical protein